MYNFFLLAAVFRTRMCGTIINSENIVGLSISNWKNHPCCWWLLLQDAEGGVGFWSGAPGRRREYYVVRSSLSYEWEYHILAERLLWTGSCKCYWHIHFWAMVVFVFKKRKKSLGKLWLTWWSWSSQSDWSLPVVPNSQDTINFILVLNDAVWKVKTDVAPLHSRSNTDKTWVVLPEWVLILVSIWKERPRTESEVGSGVLSVSNPSNFFFFFF